MATVSKFTVSPRLPERIARLLPIANNVWWTWDPEAIELFYRIDRALWDESGGNPRRLLGEVSQIRLDELAGSDSFLAHLDRVARRLDEYMASDPWRETNPGAPENFCIAYFSAEFGLHECIKIYSGGLGVLAGDHLKAASDLGLPLIGMGLLYREGYFRQYLNADGWQQETYPRNDFYNMPFEPVRYDTQKQLVIEVSYPGRIVKAYLWKCQVGRVPLYLLDCDHEDNTVEDRSITAQLYGGDHDIRIRQEIMLGMGGIKAIRALNIKPTTFHMNEGHSAFMGLQRMRELVINEKLTFDQSIETVKAGSVFTTHTPVPAGNDMFEKSLMEQYFCAYCHDVGISIEHLLPLGKRNPNDPKEPFSMTVLALKLSAGANGVSKLHGEVARNMWSHAWQGIPENEIPITSITNGIHTRSWISRDLADLYDRYLGPGWINSPDDQSIWKNVEDVPDTELWRTHERRRERLVYFARRRMQAQLANRGAPSSELRFAAEALDPEMLTIGFARRFATYKRSTLILQDLDRLRSILLNPQRPVQFIIAGKAHPADTQGKELIRDLVHFGRDPELRNHFVFIEDYDLNVARYMVQGVDCWLNTPRQPMEASGTSGMKAAANGALNISIPDGWWCEAKQWSDVGWSVGNGELYDHTDEQDNIESETLYDLLEMEVAPMFYDRGRDGLPREWIAWMKAAIHNICPVFNTYRMVQEYADRCYIPCSIRRIELMDNNRKRALELAAWKEKIAAAWNRVSINTVESGNGEALQFGSNFSVSAEVALGELTSDDVTVEIYYGELDPQGQIPTGKTVEMTCAKKIQDSTYRFEGAIHCDRTGQLGYTIRIIPNHPDLAQKHETALITWI